MTNKATINIKTKAVDGRKVFYVDVSDVDVTSARELIRELTSKYPSLGGGESEAISQEP